jgi:hypothetical protein
MNYKLCERCKFRVPDARKICQVCGSANRLVSHVRNYENISFGSKDQNLLIRFKRIFSEMPHLMANFAGNRRKEEAPECSFNNPVAAQELGDERVRAWQRMAELDLSKLPDYKNTKSDREISQLKEEIEELSQWFRNYGSGGLLTNRG